MRSRRPGGGSRAVSRRPAGWALVAALVILAMVVSTVSVAGAADGDGPAVPSENGGWHYVHLFFKGGGSAGGYACDNYATGAESACSGQFGGATTTSPWDRGDGTARWITANGKLNIGFFAHDGSYLTGYAPNPASATFVVTSGSLPFAGNDNVVSGNDPSKPASAALPGDPKDQGAPLYIGVKETSGSSLKHDGYYFDVRGWVRAAPVPPGEETSAPSDASQPTGAAGSPSDSITSFFLNLLKDPAKDFIFDKIGIKTTSAQLAEIQRQLAQLQTQLTAIGQALTDAIVDSHYSKEVQDFKDKVTPAETFLKQNIHGLVDDAGDIAQAPDQATKESAEKKYQDDLELFKRDAVTYGIPNLIEKVHTEFQPPAGAHGFLYYLGQHLMEQAQLLTRQQSEDMHEIYGYFEELQALAAWETCEYDIAIGHLKTCTDTVGPEFQADVKDQRDASKQNGLPPMLPAGVVFDRGAKYVGFIDPRDKLMWAMGGVGFSQEGTTQVPDSVPNLVDARNAVKLAGFSDWHVPSQSEIVDDLVHVELEKKTGGQPYDIKAYLVKNGLNVADGPPFLWTRDVANRDVEFYEGSGTQLRPVKVREGVDMATGYSGEYPSLKGTGPWFYSREVDFRQRVVLGWTLLARSTGATAYF